MSESACDLCNIDPPVVQYAARPFTMEIGESYVSFDGKWRSCKTCAAFVKAGDVAALAVRAAEGYGGERPFSKVLALVSEVHSQFFKNRIGTSGRVIDGTRGR